MNATVNSFNTPLQQLLLLEERVRRAGVTLPEDADQAERFYCIKCVINGQRCLMDIRAVAEVIEFRKVTPMPGSRHWIEGVMNYRGMLVPVFNLRTYFDVENAVSGLEGHQEALVVCRIGQEKQAIRVDSVNGMQKYPLSDFVPAASTDDNPNSVMHYIDASIESGDHTWWRFDIRQLLDDLICQEPMQKHAVSA